MTPAGDERHVRRIGSDERAVRPGAALAAGFLIVLLLLGVLLPGAVAPAAAATVPAPAGSGGLTLQLTGLTPRVVTADGPTTVTVLGTLRNTGARPVGELEVRLQRGDALRTDGEVRDALSGSGRLDTVAPEFTALPGVLDPGGELPVALTVPLRGAPRDGLALSRPGVYPTLVNVNGVPRGGVRARLVAVRMLLPVLSLPPGPQSAPAVPAPSGPAAAVTVLYPLADVPHRLPTVPGEQTLLTDDDLARSLAPDGRLGELLAAYADRAPPARRCAPRPAWPSTRTSSRRPRPCGRAISSARPTGRPRPAPVPRPRAGGWTVSPRPPAAVVSSRCRSPTPIWSRWPATTSTTSVGSPCPAARCSRPPSAPRWSTPPGPPTARSTSRRSNNSPRPAVGPSSSRRAPWTAARRPPPPGWCRSPGTGRRRCSRC